MENRGTRFEYLSNDWDKAITGLFGYNIDLMPAGSSRRFAFVNTINGHCHEFIIQIRIDGTIVINIKDNEVHLHAIPRPHNIYTAVIVGTMEGQKRVWKIEESNRPSNLIYEIIKSSVNGIFVPADRLSAQGREKIRTHREFLRTVRNNRT